MKKMVVGIALLFATVSVAEAAEGPRRKKRLKRKRRAQQHEMQHKIESDRSNLDEGYSRRKVQDIPESEGTSAVAPMTNKAPGLLPIGASFEVMTGRRWYEPKADGQVNGIKAVVLSGSGHAMFRPGIFALGLGPKVNIVALEFDDTDDTDMSGALAEFALESVSKLDLGFFKPFLKAEYTAFSSGTISMEGKGDSEDYDAEMDFETTGALFGIGTELMFMKNLKGVIEAQYGVQMVKTTKTELTYEDEFGLRQTDTDDENSGRNDFNSKSILFGIGGSF